MIFLTVGTQLPFDRLTLAVDRWCRDTGRSDVFGQIADPGAKGHYPAHFEWARFVEPASFSERFDTSEIVIGHAGMGTIIGALTVGKPVVILPRRADLGEHRNDHQLATAARFEKRPFIHVAHTEADLGPILDRVTRELREPGSDLASAFASDELIATIRTFIDP